jgi:hypothetical protein
MLHGQFCLQLKFRPWSRRRQCVSTERRARAHAHAQREREKTVFYHVLYICAWLLSSLPESRRKSKTQTSWRMSVRRRGNTRRRSHTMTYRWPAASIPRDLCNWESPSLLEWLRNCHQRWKEIILYESHLNGNFWLQGIMPSYTRLKYLPIQLSLNAKICKTHRFNLIRTSNRVFM